MAGQVAPARALSRWPRTLAWSMVAAAVALMALFVFLASLSGETGGPLEYDDPVAVAAYGLLILMFPVLGAIVASRHPRNAIGWMFCASGIAVGVSVCTQLYAEYDLYGRSGDLSGGEVAWWVSTWLFPLGLFVTPIFLLLLFPTGRPSSRFWSYVVRSGILVIALGTLGEMFRAGRIGVPEFGVDNPFGLTGAAGDVARTIGTISQAAAIPFLVSALVSLIVRMRRSRGDERQQLKWFAYVGMFVTVAMTISFTFSTFGERLLSDIFFVIGGLGLLALPPACAVAILKYRLYDIDVVINKTIVFGLLAAFITGIYVGIVVGLGAALGSRDEPNLALSIAATAVVAIAFSPVKERTQRVANRLVYGHRISPYEVLADLSRAVATAPTPHDVLEGVARAARVGTNALGAAVSLKLHHGDDVRVTTPAPIPDDEVQEQSLPISHLDEELGRLTVVKSDRDPFTSHDRELMDSLASQAGLALHNARLALELRVRLDEISAQANELQSSRARIVSAADDSRRRLEEQITSGPRAGLVSLREGLAGAVDLLGEDPVACAARLEALKEEADQTLDGLRELARGIYPPLLADKGMAAALESHALKHDLESRLEISEEVRTARFEEAIEATVYFCCLELIAHAPGSIDLSMERRDGMLVCSFAHTPEDETVTRIVDRVDSLGGHVGSGERFVMSLPYRVLEVAA